MRRAPRSPGLPWTLALALLVAAIVPLLAIATLGASPRLYFAAPTYFAIALYPVWSLRWWRYRRRLRGRRIAHLEATR